MLHLHLFVKEQNLRQALIFSFFFLLHSCLTPCLLIYEARTLPELDVFQTCTRHWPIELQWILWFSQIISGIDISVSCLHVCASKVNYIYQVLPPLSHCRVISTSYVDLSCFVGLIFAVGFVTQGELMRSLGGVVATSSLLGVPLGHHSSFHEGSAFAPPRIREAIWCDSTNSTTEEGKQYCFPLSCISSSILTNNLFVSKGIISVGQWLLFLVIKKLCDIFLDTWDKI